MKYIHVAGKPSDYGPDLQSPILRQTGRCLYSLIEGLRQKEFNTDTLGMVARNIRHYIDRHVRPNGGMLYADSGGYSIIKGDVHPMDIFRFIDCYNVYLKHESDIYNYIFSLDIPFSLKYDKLNTRQAIYELNKSSLSMTKNVMEECPTVRDKLHFVWHFKMRSQYEIWKRLYEELGLNHIVTHRALGGMVGLRGMTKKNFSPFIALSYRCLLDYMMAGRFGRDLTIHNLGLYILYDRFHMAFLERLFGRYLEGISGVAISYDSINPTHAARMNKGMPLYAWQDDQFMTLPNMTSAPDWLVSSVYGDDLAGFVLDEVGRRINGNLLQNVNTFAPLSIASHRAVDRYFAWAVESYGLVDLFFKCKSPTTMLAGVNNIVKDLKVKVPGLFTHKMIKSIIENMELTYFFHRWWMDRRDYARLDLLTIRFIEHIGFPDGLS